jgi:hypothetical protein
MKSRVLGNIRTMREIKTNADVLGKQKLRTTNSLFKTEEEFEKLEGFENRQLKQVVAKEKARFAALDASVERSRKSMIRARERLALTIKKNQALTETRHELQRERWEKKDPVSPKADSPAEGRGLRRVKLKY